MPSTQLPIPSLGFLFFIFCGKLATMKPLPEKELLDSLYTYDKTTGRLVHKEFRQGASKGFRAGYRERASGYRCINILGAGYKEHRIIWKIVTGHDPECIIDHKDKDPSNNRWDNLREANWMQNAHNARKKCNGKHKYKGVRFVKARGVWVGFVERMGTRYATDGFTTAKAANEALMPLRSKIHGDYATSA